MKLKTYQRVKLILVFLCAIAFSQAIVFKSYLIPIVILIVESLTLLYLRRQVKEILADERDYALGGKAALLSIQIFSWLSIIVMFILYAQRDFNPYYEVVGSTLAYSTCFLMLIYSLIYRFQSGLKPIYIFISLLLITILILAGIRLFSGEDSWICQNGTWVTHGHPNFPAPLAECK